QPRQITASNRPVSAARLAASGSSKLPGTRRTVMSASGTPAACSASIAPVSSRSVTKSLYRATTIANRIPAPAPASPSRICTCPSSAARELRRALLEKRARAFTHVVRAGADAEQRGLEPQRRRQRQVRAVVNRLQDVAHRQRRLRRQPF